MIKFLSDTIYIDLPTFTQVYNSVKDAANDVALLLLNREPSTPFQTLIPNEPSWDMVHTFEEANKLSLIDIDMIESTLPQYSDFYIAVREARKKLYVHDLRDLFDRLNDRRLWRSTLHERIGRIHRFHFGRFAKRHQFDVTIGELRCL